MKKKMTAGLGDSFEVKEFKNKGAEVLRPENQGERL